MELLSLILKVIVAASTLAGIVTLSMELAGKSIGRLKHRSALLVGGGLLLCSLLLGGLDFAVSRYEAAEAEPAASAASAASESPSAALAASTIVSGTINGNGAIIGGSGNTVTIYPGDTPEERQRKIAQAQRTLASEVLTNLRNLDARLGFTESALGASEAASPASDAPTATPRLIASHYRMLIASEQIGALRQSFNSRPLSTTPHTSLIDTLVASGADPQNMLFFYQQLSEVEDKSESLFTSLTAASRDTSNDPATGAHDDRQIALAVKVLRNRTATAYIAGLQALGDVQSDPSEVNPQLALLQHLEPRRLIDRAEVERLQSQNLAEAVALMQERAELLEDDKAQLKDDLTVHPDDPWDVVVGKARALRARGEIDAAVDAFGRYAEMFKGSDATAEQYAMTAQLFTRQIAALQVTGGMYIYEVEAGSTAEHAGLRVGDIVVQFDGQLISGEPDMKAALAQAAQKTQVPVRYLRLDAANRFIVGETRVDRLPMNANLIPI